MILFFSCILRINFSYGGGVAKIFAVRYFIGSDDLLCTGRISVNYAGEFGGSFGQGTLTTDAFKQTINNLCANTFYQFSAYVRNICRTCGVSANLVSVYNPGVKPSLTFSVNNIDMYSTGKIDTTIYNNAGIRHLLIINSK